MTDVLVGVVLVLLGLALCLRGYWTLRLVLSLWGALVGFGLGASLAAWINDNSYLASALGWIVGLALALVFALLAYLYYAVGVILSLGSMGFALGATVTAATGVTWDGVIITVGILCGLAVAALAILADVPLMLLVALSAIAGASVVVAGGLILTGALDVEQIDSANVADHLDGHWAWTLMFVVLAVFGVLTQLRLARGSVGARQGWSAQGRTAPGARRS